MVLCDIVGLSYEEIARAVAVPVGTVRSRIHRGRRLLRESLTTNPEELISAYLDEGWPDLRSTGSKRISRPVESAPPSQEMQTVRSAVRSLPLLELPAGLIPEADAGVVPLRRNKGFWVGAAAAAVALVIAIAAIVTPSTPSVALEELNSRYEARASLDPAFGPAKVVVPDLGDLLE